MKLEARISHENVQFDKTNDVYFVLSLSAPPVDWQKKRAPICLIPVIDCSSSMAGSKIEYAKQSILKLIDHLQPGDYLGLVGFSDAPFLISKPVEVTQSTKDSLKAKIGDLRPMSCTNFSDAMLMGLEHANKTDLPAGTITRVIMFTDGQANRGVAVNAEDLSDLLIKTLNKASLSAFAFGLDANQTMLADLAKVGKGNYAYVQNPEDALSAFAKELGGLLSIYAQNVKIKLSPHEGHEFLDVLSDVDVDDKGESIVITVPDMLGEETRHIVASLRLDKQGKAFPRQSSVVDVVVDYDVIDEKGEKHHHTEDRKAKVTFVKAGEETKAIPDELNQIIGLAQIVRTQIEAESKVKLGDYSGASGLFSTLVETFKSRKLDNFVGLVGTLSQNYADASSYGITSAYNMSVGSSANSAGTHTSSADSGALRDLMSAGVKLYDNASQKHMKKAFATPNVAAPTVPTATTTQAAPTLPKNKSRIHKNRSGRW